MTSLDDYVFEHRNKAYGAYTLRHSHDRYLAIGLFVSTSFLVMLFLLPWIYQKMHAPHDIVQEVWKEVNLTTEYILEPVKKVISKEKLRSTPKEQKLKPQVKFTTVQVVSDDLKTDDIKPPTQDQLQDQIISTIDKAAQQDGSELISDPQGPNENGETPIQATKPLISTTQVYDYTEIMPEFKGGEAALLKYLAKHIHYPESAQENNIEGRVIVRFVVTKTGEIDKISILRGIGGGCDEETLRVIKNMPRWKPGSQHGKSVSVLFTLPVVFKLQR